MRFKEYLLEEDRHEDIELEEAANIFLKSCGDINSPLFRVNSNPSTITKSKTTKRTNKSLGGSAEIFEYLLSQPGWENIPKRSESIFCSTSRRIVFPSGTANLIYPFKSAKLATIKASDFNDYKIKLGDEAINFGTLESLIAAFDDRDERTFERGALLASNVHQMILPEDSEVLRKRYLAWRMNVRPEWLGTYELFLDIVRKNIPSKWKPEDLEISAISVKDIPNLRKERQEVWFTGDYLSVPVKFEHDFVKAVKDLL